MKKFLSLLVVLAMLMAIATSASAMGVVGGMAEMTLGENEVAIPVIYDEEWEEYCPMPANLMWAVTEDGTLTIDFADDDAFAFYANVYVSTADGDMSWFGIEEKGGSVAVDVVVGDTVMMEVGCMDTLTEEGTITAHFTLSMGAEEEEPAFSGSGTEEDPWIVESLPAELTGTFPEDLAADENWLGYFYQFTATEAGTISFDAWTGCGLFVTVNDKWYDADAVTVAADDVVVINVWVNMGACDYSVNLGFEAGAAEGGEGEETVVLTRGDNAFVIPGGSYYGGVFTAHVAGTLTITITEFQVYDEEAGDYVLVEDPSTYFSRMGYYDLLVNDEDANASVYTIEVEAGEQVSVYINAAMGSDAVAGVNLYLEPAEEDNEDVVETPASGTVELKADETIVYEITPEADGVVSVGVSCETGWEVHIGDADGNVDSRFWSDVNTSPVTENLTAGVTYTITIYPYDQADGFAYCDATITYEITFTAAGEGGEEGGDEEPSCTHEWTYTEPDEENPEMMNEICSECGEVVAVHAPGAEKNPILVDFTANEEGTVLFATVTVPAGETMWFGQYRIGGMLLTVNGEDYGVVEDMGWYDPCVFAITNDGAEETTYELELSWPLGSEMNPDELVLGEAFEVVLPENNSGYCYYWTATEEGVFTITVDGEFWVLNVNGTTLYSVYGDSNTYNLYVMPGDEVIVSISTQDDNWGTPAATLSVTASFAVPAPTPLVLGDNEMVYGKYSFTATQTGTLYYCFTTLFTDGEDSTEEIKDIFEWDYVTLLVNGEPVEEDYFGSLEVTEGDEVIFLFKANSAYSTYTGVLNLSYEDNNPVLGSEQRPVYLEYADCPTTSIEIAAGAEAWYQLSGDFYDPDAVLTVKGENAYIVIRYMDWSIWEWVEEIIPAVDGVVTLNTENYTMIKIGNAGAEAATFEIEAYIPESHAGNPVDLVLGENVAEIEAERPDYYYFDWVAPADGTLFVTVAGQYWTFYVVDPVTGEMTEPLYFYNDPVVDTIEWAVKASDRVIVAVATTRDWMNDPGDWTLPADTLTVTAYFACAHSKLVHMDAVEPGCHFEGNVEYWVCYDCGGVWTDEALTRVSNILSVVLPEKGGDVVHVEAKDPTCTEDGNVEHWYCEDCQQVWQDEARTQLTNHMSVKRGATGHNFVNGVCTSCGANDQNVPPTGDMISLGFALIAVSGMTVIALPKKKEN